MKQNPSLSVSEARPDRCGHPGTFSQKFSAGVPASECLQRLPIHHPRRPHLTDDRTGQRTGPNMGERIDLLIPSTRTQWIGPSAAYAGAACIYKRGHHQAMPGAEECSFVRSCSSWRTSRENKVAQNTLAMALACTDGIAFRRWRKCFATV